MRPRTYQCVLLLMCAVACMHLCEAGAVNATQRQIMDDLVSEWPVLARLKEGAWTPRGMDQACNKSRISAFGVRCDDSGWVMALDWSGLRDKMQNNSEGLGLCSGATSLSRFSRLKVLIFHDTGLYGSLPSSWARLSNLQTLIIEEEPLLGNLTYAASQNWTITKTPERADHSIRNSSPSSALLSQTSNGDSDSNGLTSENIDSSTDGSSLESRSDRHQTFDHDLHASSASSTYSARDDLGASEAYISDGLPRYSASNVQSAIPESWSRLRNLVTLRLVDLPAFECQLPQAIYRSWPLLKSIQIVRTGCRGIVDKSLFWAPLQLKNVSLASSSFSGSVPSILAQSNMTFETLDLSWNVFSGTVPKVWERAPPRRLSLSGNLFSGPLPDRIGPSFEVPDNTTTNNKTKTAPKSAKLVDFSFNDFSGTVPVSLLDSWITELVLDNNDLTGPLNLPRDGKNLKRLSVKENHLSGPLPSALWNSSRLQYLDASRNDLTGPFPDTPDDVEALVPQDDDDPDPDEDDKFFFATLLERASTAIARFMGWPESNKKEPKNYVSPPSALLSISPDTSITPPAKCYMTDIILSHNPLNARLPESLGTCSLTLVRLEMTNSSLVGTVNGKFVDVNLDLNIQWSPLFGPNDTFNLNPIFSPLRSIDLSSNHLVGSLPYFFEDIDETDMYPTGTLELRVQENRFDSALHGLYFNNSAYFRHFNISNNRLKLCEERGDTYKLKFKSCDASGQFPSPCGCPSLWFPKCLHKEMRDKCITASEKVTHSTVLGAAMLFAFTYLAWKEITWMQYR